MLAAQVTRSDDYVEYCRETAKHARDLHDLALRGRDKKLVTTRVHQQIASAVELRAGDTLVDIGCGEGTMLRIAEQIGASAIGLLATEEEVELVRRAGLNVRQGLIDQVPLADETASVVVCNNVLLIVPREKIPASLREICRIAEPGARILLGEVPFVETRDPTPHFTSRIKLLSWLYHERGLRMWFGMLRRMIYWQLTGQPPILRPGTAVSFWAPPEEFVPMAESAGLKLVRYWRHDDPDTRNNYLFRKPEQS